MHHRYKAIITFLLLLAGIAQKAQAADVYGADLTYEWLHDSTYIIRMNYYQDCDAATPLFEIGLCYRNTCATTPPFYKTKLKLELGNNGQEINPICPGLATRCTDPQSIYRGLRKWKYSVEITLPARCNNWVFSALPGSRSQSTNLVDSGNLYVEATLNNQDFYQNSTPHFTENPGRVCLYWPNTIAAPTADPDSDSLAFELIPARTAIDNCNSGVTMNYGLPFTAEKPFHFGAEYINPQTGQYTMTPTVRGDFIFAMRCVEYRNGKVAGSMMKEVRYVVDSCYTPLPLHYTLDTNSYKNIKFVNGRLNLTVGVPSSFCFDVVAPMQDAKIRIQDNHEFNLPGSNMIYTNELTDSTRGCFS